MDNRFLKNVLPCRHVIARFSNDKAWPEAVWGKFPSKNYNPSELKIILNKFRNFSEKFKINSI